ncbi:MAG: DUF177 domain-containing protein [Paracoccaceae bacterium]
MRVADLAENKPNLFDLTLDETERAALAKALDLIALKKLRFQGEVVAEGRNDWTLTGMLGATVVQPCVVTLDPVTTRIDTRIDRRYVKGFTYPDEAEAEMPEDDTTEPLTAEIDLDSVLAEALALHLPPYPRADGVDLGEAVFAEPGTTPMKDEDTRPFAGLAGLRDQLKSQDED